MKYPKLFTNDAITINGYAYLVCTGINPEKRALVKSPEYNRMVYNIHLRSVKYDPNSHQPDYYCKNTELPPYEIVK